MDPATTPHQDQQMNAPAILVRDVVIPAGKQSLEGRLAIPENAVGLVIFAHGSGSSRHSPRNLRVASALNGQGIATLLADLLTAEEGALDERTRTLRFDIPLLASRLGWMSRISAPAQARPPP